MQFTGNTETQGRFSTSTQSSAMTTVMGLRPLSRRCACALRLGRPKGIAGAGCERGEGQAVGPHETDRDDHPLGPVAGDVTADEPAAGIPAAGWGHGAGGL